MYLFQSSPSAAIVQALDAAIRQDLQNNRDSYFFWLVISAAVVVIGVALEGPELVYETWNTVRRRCLRKGILRTPDWVKLAALLGWCLVVMGVAGELVAERLMSLADGNLQTFNDILLTEARKVAGDAKTSAKTAADAAAKAQDKANAVEKQADDLLTKYVAAEHDLLALKAKSLPRRLSSEQKEILRRRVATFATKSISVSCVNGGQETFDFEQDFVAAFSNSVVHLKEYLTSCNESIGPGFYPPPIEVEAGAERQGDSDILVKALIEIGVNKKDIVTKANVSKSLLVLTLGPKPQ